MSNLTLHKKLHIKDSKIVVTFTYEVDGNNLTDLVASDHMTNRGIRDFALGMIEYAKCDIKLTYPKP